MPGETGEAQSGRPAEKRKTRRRRGSRKSRNLIAGSVFFVLIAITVIGTHFPLWDLPFFWDEAGYFVPASLDLFRHGAIVPTSTPPNVHPPGLSIWLSAVWTVAGYSISATRVAMLLMASAAAFLAFLLSLRLSGGVPGLPGFQVLLLLLLNPLFYTQSMMAQLDMPAMLFTLAAIYLFFEERLLLSVLACTLLVWMKETGAVLPVCMAILLLAERRRQEAWLFLVPLLSLVPWLWLLWKQTGSPLGNREFAEFNLLYPLHPMRLGLALLRRVYELGVNHGYLLGALPLLALWRRLELFRRREWRLLLWFTVAHVVAVSVTGGAVLERYLLPVLPLVLIAYSFAWNHLSRGWRIALPAGTAALSLLSFFVPPVFPQPHENGLRMVRLVGLMRVAAREAEVRHRDEKIVTAWPLSDGLLRPELGYVQRPLRVVPLENFAPSELARAAQEGPDVLIWFSRDPRPAAWLAQKLPVFEEWRRAIYGWDPEGDVQVIEQTMGLREATRLRVGGESMAVFRRW
jgi:4-amino-4-deoxy-L-arabinose transferase-like glycosyltransferase